MSDDTQNTQTGTGCPMASRRQVLGAIGGGALLTTGGGMAWAETPRTPAHVADAPTGDAQTARQSQPWTGTHQAGIATPRPANGIVAAFNLVLSGPADTEQFFRTLTGRIAFLTQGGPVPARDPKLPPADSGILGDTVAPDNLTITVGLGASFFDKHDWIADGLKPNSLVRMEQFPNDALRSELCHGDLSVQFNANTQDTCIHALRDIIKILSQYLVLSWMQDGNVPPEIPPSDGSRAPSARNFLGFRDGSANPDTNDAALMEQIVWIGADGDEPDWATGGTYQALRIIRNFVERWDRTPLQEQEAIFGRRRISGAPLAGGSEYDDFDYADDPDGDITPLDAHIRLANPRNIGTLPFIRRALNYSNGVEKNGQINQGLLFISYQRDLNTGFIDIQNRLNGEPLEEYIKPVGGGYFFILPGAVDANDYIGRTLVEAIKP
ncbi:iron uptake transporter deferrochelatase/peroxidase subunit [Paracoccus sp. (in: a-proteobacteria)]|uniref:iron uptake transporter deferrochelatase/peroxidase subunit n=1 Tax=Paracoccus sp. TaxID=267 RepID=UPI003A8405DD